MKSVLVALSLSVAATPSASGRLGQTPTEFHIASTHVNGAHRYAAEDVVRLSGLHIGSTVSPADLTSAANRLASTGLFNSVKYTYTTMGPQLALTFDIEEAAWTIPVVFDNFVSIPDAELTEALRKDVPSFDGTAPENTGASDLIANALQAVLAARGVPGRVSGTTYTDVVHHSTRYVFSVHDPSPITCAIHVSGASALSEHDLVEPLSEVIGHEYSRIFLMSSESGTLLDMYHHRGYWDAQFEPPSLDTGACAGVAVTLTVREGAPYAWGGAEWSGNTARPATTLDRVLGMKAGEVADGKKMDDGLLDVHSDYGRHGYVLEKAAYTPGLDRSSHRAIFKIAVAEGAQFRMGELTFEGISPDDAKKLSARFTLKSGDIFDASYTRKYSSDELSQLRTAGGARPHLETAVDTDRNVVDVKVVFR